MREPVLEVTIPGLSRHTSGKVRDIFLLDDAILLVSTDRISAFDVVMPNGIPDKGEVLTQLSNHWFSCVRPFINTHIISCDDSFIAMRLKEWGASLDTDTLAMLKGRCMLGVKAEPLPVECVVRGYLAGSLWAEYKAEGGEHKDVILHGIKLPGGLNESAELPTPIFTPATKATSGHDENIGMHEAVSLLGQKTADSVRDASLMIYEYTRIRSARAGLILADTKFEFGFHNGSLILIDEALTPDSSRYWEASMYAPGKSQPSYDKQFVRDWLLNSGWNREPPGPILPADIVMQTRRKYLEAYERLTGSQLQNSPD